MKVECCVELEFTTCVKLKFDTSQIIISARLQHILQYLAARLASYNLRVCLFWESCERERERRARKFTKRWDISLI